MNKFLWTLLLMLASATLASAADDDNYELFLVDTIGGYTPLNYAKLSHISFRQTREDLDGDGSSCYENYLQCNYNDGTTAEFNLGGKVLVLFDEQSGLVGDVNADGKVDISDIVGIINHIAGSEGYSQQLCNVNGDAAVDISDIVAVINIIAGTPVYLVGSELPDNIYVALSNEHNVIVYKMPYVSKIGIAHPFTSVKTLVGRNDSVQFTLADGQKDAYLLRQTDSILFHAPDSLMRAYLAYRDGKPSSYYPTYSDDYRKISGWSSRNNWQLANVHDPTVMKAADGYYYMSQTDAGFGNPQDGKGHFYVRRSKDMIKWEPASSYNNSMAMPVNVDSYGNDIGPSWLLDSVNVYRQKRGVAKVNTLQGLGFWAPTMRKVNDHLYRMYYSIVIDGVGIKSGLLSYNNGWVSDGSWPEAAWIGLLETDDPASGKWVDKGGVLCSASDKSKTAYARGNNDWNAYSRFNAIDPSYIITPEGEHWLIYGSWHSGIAAIELDPETGKTKTPVGDPWNIGTGQTTTHGKLIATRNKSSRWQGSEGPEVVYNPETGYYYLFLAYDGLDVPYNTRVVRSRKIDGPYTGKNGTNVTTNGGDAFPIITHPYQFNSSLEHDGWVGISHCAVWNDGQGNWFFSSQGRKPNDYSVDPNWAPNAIMMGHVRRIYWTNDGWPVVSPERYAGVIDAPISRDDLVGTWELIDLAYSYGNQKTSTTLTIAASALTTTSAKNRVTLKGAINGNGVFDPSTNMLKITPTGSSSSYYVNVARELDWEAARRVSTIVFAGYPSPTSTYWAKKTKD